MQKNPEKIKLIVFDVDGTLVDDNQKLSQKTINVIEKLNDLGLLISFATGKIFPSVEELVKILNIKTPIILANGALIQKPNADLVMGKFLPLDVINIILNDYREFDADLALFTPDSVFVEKETINTDRINNVFKEKVSAIGSWQQVVSHFPVVCKMVFINLKSQKAIDLLTNYLRENLDGKVSLSTGAPNSIEVMPFGVSKKSGLLQLIDYLKIPLDSVMAFGDQKNDFQMIECAGIGVAVGNAIDEVKNISDYVIGTNNQEGPANFLSEYLLT